MTRTVIRTTVGRRCTANCLWLLGAVPSMPSVSAPTRVTVTKAAIARQRAGPTAEGGRPLVVVGGVGNGAHRQSHPGERSYHAPGIALLDGAGELQGLANEVELASEGLGEKDIDDPA